MTPAGFQIRSELAYDLMQEHLDTMLALLEGPLPRQHVEKAVGSEAVVRQLLRQGLIEAEGDQLFAVAETYYQWRQEGMVSFLERYVLPSLAATMDEDRDSVATLHQPTLTLSENAMRSLRNGPVDDLFRQLSDIADTPASGQPHRLSVLVVGTSRVAACAELDPYDRALCNVKNASLQRASKAERHLSILSQFDALADTRRYCAAADAVDAFVSRFEEVRACPDSEATYHLTIATHWRCANLQNTPRVEDQGGQLC